MDSNPTPELPPVGLHLRLGAMLYDGLLLIAVFMVAGTPVVMLAGGADSAFVRGPGYSLYLYSIGFLFFGWFWTHGGQTLGMKSWRLKLVNETGGPISWQMAGFRYLTATVSLCLFGLGFLAILLNKQRLAWHDQLSKSHLVRLPKKTKAQAAK